MSARGQRATARRGARDCVGARRGPASCPRTREGDPPESGGRLGDREDAGEKRRGANSSALGEGLPCEAEGRPTVRFGNCPCAPPSVRFGNRQCAPPSRLGRRPRVGPGSVGPRPVPRGDGRWRVNRPTHTVNVHDVARNTHPVARLPDRVVSVRSRSGFRERVRRRGSYGTLVPDLRARRGSQLGRSAARSAMKTQLFFRQEHFRTFSARISVEVGQREASADRGRALPSPWAARRPFTIIVCPQQVGGSPPRGNSRVGPCSRPARCHAVELCP